MEDSFRVRVDKVFGSLASSQGAASSSLSSLWCLTDEEIERKEWNRDKDRRERDGAIPGPFLSNNFFGKRTAPNLRSQLEKDLDDVGGNGGSSDEDDDPSSSRSRKPDDHSEEEWEIRSSVGRDCTLDFEEEEDEFDKVAVGKEKPEDRVYMKDVNDYETEADDWGALPESFKDASRDPRANHIAAKLRLKEDAEAAKQMGALCVSENDDASTSIDDTHNLKPILKRKDPQQTQLEVKQQKRVRFTHDCKNDTDVINDIAMEACATGQREEGVKFPPDRASGIPDYMRNPSKYTCYTFDSSEMSEETNRQAFIDFMKMIRSPRAEKEIDEGPVELPKSVAFVAKKKPGEANTTEPKKDCDDGTGKDAANKRGLPVSIAAGDNDEVCSMEEDEPEIEATTRSSTGRSNRRYRMKAKGDTDEG